MRNMIYLTVFFLLICSWVQAEDLFGFGRLSTVGSNDILLGPGEPLAPQSVALPGFTFLFRDSRVVPARFAFNEEKFRFEKRLINIALICLPLGILGGVAVALSLPALGWIMIGSSAVITVLIVII